MGKSPNTSTNNSMVKTIGLSKYDSQQMEIEIVSGRFQGRRLSATNNILDKKEMDRFLSPDENPFVVIDHYQLDATMLLFAAVILVLVVFTGWIGFKALISFICSTAFISKFYYIWFSTARIRSSSLWPLSVY